ncbi:MAG: methyltransferase domain-containing protein [Anaerolineae bacterium]|nr:methyltransferase domain-containing protein [Anaerolineae bacterium]
MFARLRDPYQRLYIRYTIQLALNPLNWVDATHWVCAAYAQLVNRAPTSDEVNHWNERIRARPRDRLVLIWLLLTSAEFLRKHPNKRLPVSVTAAAEELHRARVQLVRTELPSAEVIVDLGGACSWSIEGALLAFGYPHPAREITIFDLPPDQRMFADTFKYLSAERSEWMEVRPGVRVRYWHRSFVDLDGISDQSVDLVWSGETIEHVTREEARQTIREVYRVLKPGGYFCLDTPNRLVTRLQFPDRWIHPEHKYEYTPQELSQGLQEAGFEVLRMLGICPMPRSVQQQVFDVTELYVNARITDEPENCYLFYVEARKPS